MITQNGYDNIADCSTNCFTTYMFTITEGETYRIWVNVSRSELVNYNDNGTGIVLDEDSVATSSGDIYITVKSILDNYNIIGAYKLSGGVCYTPLEAVINPDFVPSSGNPDGFFDAESGCAVGFDATSVYFYNFEVSTGGEYISANVTLTAFDNNYNIVDTAQGSLGDGVAVFLDGNMYVSVTNDEKYDITGIEWTIYPMS